MYLYNIIFMVELKIKEIIKGDLPVVSKPLGNYVPGVITGT